MEKKKINKLVVPLTLRSATILGAITLASTTLSGCGSKEKNKDVSTKIESTQEEVESSNNIKEDNKAEVKEEIKSDPEEKEQSENNQDNSVENSNQQSTLSQKENQNNNAQNNNINKKPSASDNTNNNQSNNQSNNNTAPSQDENKPTSTEDKFVPLTVSNVNDTKIFERAVLEIAKNTRGGFGGGWGYYYNNQIYHIKGFPVNEFKYVLVALNNDYMNNDTMNYLLESYSEEDLKRFYSIIGPMAGFVENANTTNNWNGLILNSKTLSEFNAIERAMLQYKNNNVEPLKQLVDNYDSSNNPLVGYYLAISCEIVTSNSSIKDDEFINKYLGLKFAIKPECEALASKIYSNSHGKAKILD